jgi:hypothetical protein
MSKSKPFFWLHIKKAGGNSVREVLEDVYVTADREEVTPFIAVPKEQWNDTVNNYRMPLGKYDFKRMLFAKKYLYREKEFDTMFKFVVVRNPYDRAVSCWQYCTRGSRKWALLNRAVPKKGFETFLRQLPEIWKSKVQRHTATHTAPVYPDITDGEGRLLVDFTAKLENIDDDFKIICRNIGIEVREFPSVNKTQRKRPYQDFYNRTTKQLVEELYGEDIEHLGYTKL